MEEKLRVLSQKTGLNFEEVKELFEENLKTLKEVLDVPEEKLKILAYNKTHSALKLKLQQGIEDVSLVVLGAGRSQDWAEIQRNKAKRIIKEKGLEEGKKMGLIDNEGNYLYTDDFRTGKVIPEKDFQTVFYCAASLNGKIMPVDLEVRSQEVSSKIVVGHEIRVRAQKITKKTTDSRAYYRFYGPEVKLLEKAKPEQISALTEAVCKDVLSIDYDKEGSFNELLKLKDNKNFKVLLRNFPVQNVREGVGAGKMYEVSLDTPDFDTVSQIKVYVQTMNGAKVLEGYPVNILCELSGYNQERKSMSANSLLYWLAPEIAKRSEEVAEPTKVSGEW